MKKTDEFIAQSIMFAIDSVSKGIQRTSDCDGNMVRAETIAVLSIAYSAVRSRKKNWFRLLLDKFEKRES